MPNSKKLYINSVNLKSDTNFPYLVLEVIGEHSYPLNPGFRVMHWHEDLQYIYVMQGTIHIQTLNDEIVLQAGDGIFINKQVVHLVKQMKDCHYMSFIFPEYILKFYPECPANELTNKLIEQEHITFCHFPKHQSWCKPILHKLQELATMEKNKPEFYEYEVMLHLFSLILLTQKNHQLSPAKSDDAVSIRMRQFLEYIEKHYSEDVTLDALAQSAHVSKSECLRCFKLSMQTTPYKYLMEYRLSKAAQLLRQSNQPIGVISSLVGFHQMSQFGKYFKEKLGCTPREYRNDSQEIKCGNDIRYYCHK